MVAMDADFSSLTPPRRSGYDLTGGLVYFARMLDKIRLQAAGRLQPAYQEHLGGGFDGRCCRYLGIDYPALCHRTLAGGSDEDVLEWCYEHGLRLNAEHILVWNKFLTKRGLARRGRWLHPRTRSVQSR